MKKLIAVRVIGVLSGVYAIFNLVDTWQSPFGGTFELVYLAYLLLLLPAALGTVFANRLARLALSILLALYACFCEFVFIEALVSGSLAGIFIAVAGLVILAAAWAVYPGRGKNPLAS